MPRTSNIFEQPSLVQLVTKRRSLDRAEESILKINRQKMSDWRMLDVGIGTGRTTPFFSPFVRQYTGIDNSDAMLEVARKNYSELPNVRFMKSDTRDLSLFEDNSFDFILCSYHGLDSLSMTDRDIAMKELRRVGRKWSKLCINMHNIHHLPQLFSFRLGFNFLLWPSEYKRVHEVMRRNPDLSELMKGNYAKVYDGNLGFDIMQKYIRPEYQMDLLKELDYINIEVYSNSTGNRIKYPTDWSLYTDQYLYFLCTNDK